MKPPATSLRRATVDDAAVTLTWTPPSREALHLWAGPSARYPATAESLWHDVSNADATSFALVSGLHGVVGFGQVRYRQQIFGHLARIIVSPTHRGTGYGRAICQALMREALILHPTIQAFTLFVYSDNINAIGLYESLGFAKNGMHAEFKNMFLMEAPLSAAAPQAE